MAIWEGVMNLPVGNIIWLLALANKPASAFDVGGWKPFKQDTLSYIIEEHNERCRKGYKRCGLLKTYAKYIEKIEIIKNHLDTIMNMASDEFDGVKIIMIDLDAIDIKSKLLHHVLFQIGGQYNKSKQKIIAAEVTHKDSRSVYDNILEEFVMPAYPQDNTALIQNQDDFELWLGRFCESLINCYIGVEKGYDLKPPSTGLDGALISNILAEGRYLDRYNLAARARDVAMMRNLSPVETETLANRLTVQEISLNWLRTQIAFPAIFDHIRCPTVEIDIASGQPEFDWNMKPLWAIKLTRAPKKLTGLQKFIVEKLGLTRDHTVIHYDLPEIRDELGTLGGSIETHTFEALLPDVCKMPTKL
jgi:hypothetical protein